MSNTYFNISDKLRLYEFDGMLDKYGDATAAYSLRKLRNGYTGDAIRVRRSSDDAERDMGFYDNELDTVALLDWVNQDVVYYQSDFRASNPYTGYIARLTSSVGESVAGVDDAIKLTLTGGLNAHDIVPILNRNTIVGQEFTLEFDYYIPSTNAAMNNILNFNTFSSVSSTTANFDVLDEWTSVSVTGTTVDSPGNVDLFLRARSGTSQSFAGDGDVFYLKNIVFTQVTADGLVQTWYDQSANTNHAVQNTDSAQPKIVDAGTLVTEGGKPTVYFVENADNFFNLTSGISGIDYSFYTVLNMPSSDAMYGGILITGTTSNYSFMFHKTSYGIGYFTNSYQGLIPYSNTTGRILASQFVDSSESVGYKNGSIQNTKSITNTGSTLAELGGNWAGRTFMGYMQEAVLYTEKDLVSRTDIETNINTYYNIY